MVKSKNSYDLSEHFNSSEFACRCGKCIYRADYSSGEELIVSRRLVEKLEYLRKLYNRYCEGVRLGSNNPINITSGRRCEHRNRVVRGVKNSKHLFGLASDIQAGRMDLLYQALLSEPIFDYVEFHPSYIHVDIGGKRNNRYSYSSGFTSYSAKKSRVKATLHGE